MYHLVSEAQLVAVVQNGRLPNAFAIDEHPIDAAQVLNDRGLPIELHRSVPTRRKRIVEYHLTAVMTAEERPPYAHFDVVSADTHPATLRLSCGRLRQWNSASTHFSRR